MTFDVTIIGGGIAAAASARVLARRRLSWCVVAPNPPGGERIGESLAPTALPLLKELNLEQAFHQLNPRAGYSRFSIWGADRVVEQSSIMHRAGHSWCLDRPAFEAMLWQNLTVPNRVTAKVRGVEGKAGDRELQLDDGSQIRTRYLLDCTGRRAAVTRHFTDRSRLDQLVAVYDFLDQVEPDVAATPGPMTESRPDGWWYSALLPSGRMVVTWFTDTDTLPRDLRTNPERRQALLQEGPYTWKRITSAGYQPHWQPRTTDAGSLRATHFAGQDWIAVGDAAMAFDPLSSHGITAALWGGLRAAEAAVADLQGNPEPKANYCDTLEKAWTAYRNQHQAAYRAESRFHNKPFWQQRHNA